VDGGRRKFSCRKWTPTEERSSHTGRDRGVASSPLVPPKEAPPPRLAWKRESDADGEGEGGRKEWDEARRKEEIMGRDMKG